MRNTPGTRMEFSVHKVKVDTSVLKASECGRFAVADMEIKQSGRFLGVGMWKGVPHLLVSNNDPECTATVECKLLVVFDDVLNDDLTLRNTPAARLVPPGYAPIGSLLFDYLIGDGAHVLSFFFCEVEGG